MSEKIKVLVISDDCAAHTGFGTVIRNLFGPMAGDPRLDLKAIALYPMKAGKPRVVPTIASDGPPDDEHGIETLGKMVKAEGWPDIIFLLGDYWYWHKTLLNDQWKKQNGCVASVWYYVPFDGIQMTTICKRAYQSADKLIAMSPFGAKMMPEYTERQDMVTLLHGFNAEQFPYRRRDPKLGPMTFGVVSRNARRKNLWAIIAAYWALPSHMDVRMVLHTAKDDRVGGNLAAWIEFQEQVAEMNGKKLRPVEWTDGIKIEGNGNVSSMAGVKDGDMAGIYERMDCVVSAGREGFGLPYLEARASGCRLILPQYSAHASMEYPDAIYYPCPWTKPDPGAPDVLDIAPDPAMIKAAMEEAYRAHVGSGGPGPLPEMFTAPLQWSRLSLRLHSWIMAHGQSKPRLQARDAKAFHAVPWSELTPAKLGSRPRIGVVMPESHGDVLLMTGVLSNLRKRFPAPHFAIDFITKAQHFQIVAGCPWVDEVIEFNPGIHPNYDKMLRMYEAYFTPYFQTQVAGNWVNGGYGWKHLVEVYADACGVEVGEFFLPREQISMGPVGKYITLHPGSGSGQQALRWYERWPEVVSAVRRIADAAVVQIGVATEPLIKGVDLDMRGKTSHSQMNNVLAGAVLHLGIDSYPTHVAGLSGTKVVALFGNTRPECTGPYGVRDSMFTAVRATHCVRPCHLIRCPITEGGVGCMHEISPEAVVEAVKEMLG